MPGDNSESFDLLLEYERHLLGEIKKDLSGKPFLSTALQWFNDYLSTPLNSGHIGDLPLYEIAPRDWSAYPFWLIKFTDLPKSERSKAEKTLESFLKWLITLLNDQSSALEQAIQALKLGKKERERIDRLHSHLSQASLMRIFSPNPTQSPETMEWEEEMHDSQFDLEGEEVEDLYCLQAKNKALNLAYFHGELSNRAIVFKGDPQLLKYLRRGDRIQMRLQKTQDGGWILLHYELPFETLPFPEVEN